MIYVLSGGSANPYAVIGVTYPSGSTVTCTNGAKTFTAKDTSGKAMFIIPSAGTWTVKAVKGSQNKSVAVSITSKGQVEAVTIVYEYYLFNGGKVNDITWGAIYTTDNMATAAVSDVIKLTGYTYDASSGARVAPSAYCGTSSKIDLASWNSLKIHAKTCDAAKGSAYCTIGSSVRGSDISSTSVQLAADATTTVSLSSVSGSYYVTLRTTPYGADYGSTVNVGFDKVWLE